MQISVIIPVYNAEKYLKEAVESAVNQEETGEVILIEDCSPDNSLEGCQKLASKYEKIKLYQHPDKGNHGAGATRNLGIKKAQCDYIAFLDADDYYLENRFKNAKKIFSEDPTIEGVYEAIGTKFESEEVKNKWIKRGLPVITTVKQKIKPEKLFEKLIMGNNGHFHGDGLVVKKEVFDKAGFFNEELRVSQDTHMYFKLAALAKLVPGDIKSPVAIRRVHENNRFNKTSPEEKQRIKMKFFSSLLKWAKEKNLEKKKMAFIYYKKFFFENIKFHSNQNRFKRIINRFLSILKFSLSHPPSITFPVINYYLKLIIKMR